MTRGELIWIIVERHGLNEAEARRMVGIILDALKDALKSGQQMSLRRLLADPDENAEASPPSFAPPQLAPWIDVDEDDGDPYRYSIEEEAADDDEDWRDSTSFSGPHGPGTDDDE